METFREQLIKAGVGALRRMSNMESLEKDGLWDAPFTGDWIIDSALVVDSTVSKLRELADVLIEAGRLDEIVDREIARKVYDVLTAEASYVDPPSLGNELN